jgi:hypothetical protein
MEEKEIFVDYGDGSGMLLEYSLSNDLAEIEHAIKARVGVDFSLDNIGWRLNPVFSESVKELMTKHDINYSMTTILEGTVRSIVINRRMENEWFVYLMDSEEYMRREFTFCAETIKKKATVCRSCGKEIQPIA